MFCFLKLSNQIFILVDMLGGILELFINVSGPLKSSGEIIANSDSGA